MRIIVKFEKQAPVRFISHLDVQRAFHRTIRRAGIPIAFSQGFNPHPLTSFASALSVGVTGGGELMDMKLSDPMEPECLVEAFNQTAPDGLQIVSAFLAPEGFPALTVAMHSADYTAVSSIGGICSTLDTDKLLSGPILVEKRKKHGKCYVEKTVNIRDMVYSFVVENDTTLSVRGRLDVSGGLNVDMLLNYINKTLCVEHGWRVHRNSINLNSGVDVLCK